MKKLAIISTHPIQYNAPLFRMLHERKRIQLKVFYTWEQSQQGTLYDPGFGIYREWDIPMLEGYDFVFLKNTSSKPGSHHFWGIINPTLIDEVKAYAPDALLVFGWSFFSHLKLMWKFHGKVPLFFRGDSTLLDERNASKLKTVFRRLFLRNVYKLIDFALYTGIENKKYFLRHGLKENQLSWVPHTIDNNRFGNLKQEEEQQIKSWRKELGFSESNRVFLFAGKLESKKNPVLLLESFLNLKDNRAGLVFAGNGELENELKRRADGEKNICFLGFQNQRQMPLLYRLADVFVLPSSGPGETWGLAVNEAMASGRAVIVSNQCGCAADLVKGNGFLFESGSTIQLTSILHEFLEQPQLAFQMGQKGRELIQEWSITIAAQKIEETICR